MSLSISCYCGTCGAFVWSEQHVCPPKWKGWVDGWGDEDDPDTVYARDAEDAAEELMKKVAERADGDTKLAQTFEVFVFIPDEVEHDMPKVKKFDVTGEYDITWSVREAD